MDKASLSGERKLADFESELIDGLRRKQPLAGPDGLLSGLIKHVAEAALSAEPDDHLARDREQRVSNKCNSRTRKSVRTDFGSSPPSQL